MAKRGRNNKRQQRRETIRARSQQAQLNERLRDYSTGRIPAINDRNLGKLTVRQLEQVAGRVAQKVEERQEALRARDARVFQATPDVTITKLDRELANRPLITDEQIDNAPSKRRKTLRQQQRRRVQAREKIKRAQQYNAFNMQQYTVGELRDLESRGESPFEVLGGRIIHETPEDNLVRSRKNVLANKTWVREKIRHGRRDELEAYIKAYAGVAGMKPIDLRDFLPSNLRSENFRPLTLDYRSGVYEQKLESMGVTIAARYSRLSNRAKNWLLENTTFMSLLDESTHYDENQKKWATNAGAMPDVKNQIADYLTQAEQMK